MKSDKISIEDRAARLSHRERAQLAFKLLASLEPGLDEDADSLWLYEAEQRLQKFAEHDTFARDAEESIAEIERQLK